MALRSASSALRRVSASAAILSRVSLAIAWARALGEASVLASEEVSTLVAALQKITLSDSDAEDVHSYVEAELRDPSSFLRWTKRMLEVRKGDRSWVYSPARNYYPAPNLDAGPIGRYFEGEANSASGLSSAVRTASTVTRGSVGPAGSSRSGLIRGGFIVPQ